MKKNYLLATIVFLFSSLSLWSQVNKGLELFLLEDYQEAEKVFQQSISQDPDMSYYYLGEIALRNNNQSEAADFYAKGISSNPDATYSLIGKTKLELQSNPSELKKSLNSIAKKNRKNAPVLLAIAQAYLDNKMLDEISDVLDMARKADKTYPYIYIFEGDRFKAIGEPGNAATQYEHAINFDPKCAIAYVKNAMIYESNSPTAAIDILKRGLEANPDNILISIYLARNSYKNGYYSQAIAQYDKISQQETLSSEDARNYAACLYFTDKYNEALAALNQIAEKEPNQPVINRLLMYTHDKLKNYDEVVTIGKRFFGLSNNGESPNYLITDYTVYADGLMQKGQIDEAIKVYEKGLALDPEQAELYKEVAAKLASADRLADAANFYQKYIDATSSQDASDFLQLGIYNYRAASKYSSKINALTKKQAETDNTAQSTQSGDMVALKDSLGQFVSKADSAFAKVTEFAPESYQGYYWRANANTLLDPDLSKGLANEHYLKMINILVSTNDVDNQSKLIEAYRYFSIYYLYQYDANKQLDNKNKAKEYANKVLELEPGDDTSLKILEVLNN